MVEFLIDGRVFRRTIEKEVKMSGKIRIGGLVLAAALIILFAGVSFGQDPCGGHYVGTGLKAMFLAQYGVPTCTEDGGCNVLNDTEGVYYQYFVPGGDCVYLFKAGHVIVGIGNSGRHVVMNFEQTSAGEAGCEALPFVTCNTQEFMLTTGFGFTASRNEDGELVLTSTNVRLNFGGMKAGNTYYCQTSIKFRVANDPAEYQHHFQAKVSYGTDTGIWVGNPHIEPIMFKVTK
jgi:hypothetical protein